MLQVFRRSLVRFPAGVLFGAALSLAAPARAQDAQAIIKAAIDYWRDTSSYSVAQMTIHRPDWERRMTIRVWTRGDKQSLVRVVAPPKDAGNATLLVDNEMWTYNPRINRVLKIPSSMMNQSWMGSDFSNNDLAKADDLIEQYNHRLLRTETRDGHKAYVIESRPKEFAPVVWGREVETVRDDYILLEHTFYDQAGELIKKLTTEDIRPMGGKTIAAKQRMQRVDKPGEWTEVATKEARFGVDIPRGFFSQPNLRNPRE
jgi:outer membrane lipoprotein-sorting protein